MKMLIYIAVYVIIKYKIFSEISSIKIWNMFTRAAGGRASTRSESCGKGGLL